MANNTILAMNALQSNIIREITPLSDKDCFYIAERYKTEFTYPIHNHAEFELNFTEKAAGVRRIVGDSAEVISDYDLVLIAGKDLEHVWEQHDCHSKEIREITIQFSSDLFFKSFINKNQFDSIRDMLEKAQKRPVRCQVLPSRKSAFIRIAAVCRKCRNILMPIIRKRSA